MERDLPAYVSVMNNREELDGKILPEEMEDSPPDRFSVAMFAGPGRRFYESEMQFIQIARK